MKECMNMKLIKWLWDNNLEDFQLAAAAYFLHVGRQREHFGLLSYKVILLQ